MFAHISPYYLPVVAVLARCRLARIWMGEPEGVVQHDLLEQVLLVVLVLVVLVLVLLLLLLLVVLVLLLLLLGRLWSLAP